MIFRLVRMLIGAAVAAVVFQALALGTALAHGWSVEATPSPPGSTFTQLRGVSCSSSSSCFAVGGFSTSGSSGAMTLAERWDGTSWTIQSTPNASGATESSLAGVSCTSDTSCIAVGWSLGWINQPYFSAPLAERWDGTSWTLQSPPIPPNATDSELDGVSCIATPDCTAVGHYQDAAGDEAFAEHWNGASWTLQNAVSPPAGSFLQGVSCRSATSCAAVGGTGDTVPYGGLTWAEGWNGVAWTSQATSNPAGSTDTALSGVSCISATACTAVGSSTVDPGTLAEAWDGVAWSIEPTPSLPSSGALSGVSCPSTSVCVAVGRDGSALAERWNGSSWMLQSVPNPTGATGSELNGVSCLKPNECSAVGSYVSNTNTGYQPLIEHYS